MNRWSIKIGLGIAIYLSSSIVDSRSGLATSLVFSDRYELTQLNDDPLFSPKNLSFPSIFNPNYINYIEIQNLQEIDNFSLYEVQTTESSASSEEIQDLFSASESNVRVEMATNDSESFNLLDSLNTAVRSLQFNALQDNSFANPRVVILPQVAYENIYRGLYDFDIEIADVPSGNSSASSPRTVNNSIPEELLISRESAIEYSSPAFGAAQPTRDFYNDNTSSGNYYSGSREDGNRTLLNKYIKSGKINSLLKTEDYENSNRRFGSAVSNVSNKIEDIAIESQFKTNKFSKIGIRKNSKIQEIEQQLAEQQKENEEERKKLLDRLKKQQEEREKRQELQRMKLKKQREDRLRKTEERQKQQFERQRVRYGNN